KKQAWKLIRYAVPIMTGGVAVARRHKPSGFVKFSFPSKIRFMQQTSREREIRKSIASKIAGKLHLSTAKAMVHMLPYISFIAANDKESGKALAEYFDLTPTELAYLAGEEAKAERAKVKTAAKRARRRKRTA
ncbi:MAG: hypothetical protein J7L83_01120, partial [Thaumarchaeota archaeon]|nr:hypothetical protein [Nitrososphaerota archaeon]